MASKILKDVRVIYLILLILTVTVLISPLALPLRINSTTQNAYDLVQKLPAGSNVLVIMQVVVGGIAEIGPQLRVVTQHLFSLPLHVVFVAFHPDGPVIVESYLLPGITGDKKYGVDYVDLGFVSGGETGMAAFANDVHKTVSKDYRGSPIDSLPIMTGIKSAKDFALTELFDTQSDIVLVLRQFQTPYNVKIILGTYAMLSPGAMPFVRSGQVAGLLDGTRGAAEYELLLKKPARAVSGMDALSLDTLYFLALIFIGNASYFMLRKKGASLTRRKS